MAVYLVGIYILFGFVLSRGLLVAIRPMQSDNVLKVEGKEIKLTPDRTDRSTVFRVVMKRKKGVALFGMKIKAPKNIVLISPESSRNLYLGSGKSGVVLQKKRKRWMYEPTEGNGYTLDAGDGMCLTLLNDKGLGVSKCDKRKEQIFIFEEKIYELSTTTSDDERSAMISSGTTGKPKATVYEERGPLDSTQSLENSDSDSDALRPILLNLNVKDTGAASMRPPDIHTVITTSTTTVYVSITKSLAREAKTEPVIAIINESSSADNNYPSKVVPPRKRRRRGIQKDGSPLSYCLNDAVEMDEMLHSLFFTNNCNPERRDENLNLDPESYPELGKLLGQMYVKEPPKAQGIPNRMKAAAQDPVKENPNQ